MRKFSGGQLSSELQKTVDDLKYLATVGFDDARLTAAREDPSSHNETLMNLVRDFERLTGNEFRSFSQLDNIRDIRDVNADSITNPIGAIEPVDTSRPRVPNTSTPTINLLDPIVIPQSNGTCPVGYVLQNGECKLRMPSSLILRQLKHYSQIAPTQLDEYNRNRGSFAISEDRRFFERLVKAFEASTGLALNSYTQLQSYTSQYEDFPRSTNIPRPTDDLIQSLVANFAEFKRQTGIPFVYARQVDKLLDRRTGPDTDTLGRPTGPSEYNVSGGRRKTKKSRKIRRY